MRRAGDERLCVRIGRPSGVAAVAVAACLSSASAHAAVVSMALTGGVTLMSSNLNSLVNQGFLPVRFAYVTGGSSQTGPVGTQFFASNGLPQYISIDLGFRTIELLSGHPSSGISGNVLMKKGPTTDLMEIVANQSLTDTLIRLQFLDTSRFFQSQFVLPSPFPSASAFSTSNNGLDGLPPAFGFEIIFRHNGQLSWVRGDLFPSALTTAPIPPGVPAPTAAAVLALAGIVASRRRRG